MSLLSRPARFSTPAKMLAWMVACLCLGLALCASAVIVAERRRQAVAAIEKVTAEQIEAAWDVHRHLARAAAAEAATFLSLPVTPPTTTTAGAAAAAGTPGALPASSGEGSGATAASLGDGSYAVFEQAMRDATAAMVRAGASTDPSTGQLRCPDPETGRRDAAVPAATAALTTLVCVTPVYTRNIGEARANNRNGFSVGAAYLRTANALMHQQLLPASAELARLHSAAQAAQLRQATSAAGATAVAAVGLLALAALAVTQILLALWTRRLFNPLLLAATALLLAGLAWQQVAFADERAGLAAAQADGHEDRALLARVRQLALRAEGDLLYWRIAQGGDVLFNADYDRTARELACAARGLLPADGDPAGGEASGGEASGGKPAAQIPCAEADPAWRGHALDPGLVSLVLSTLDTGAEAIDSEQSLTAAVAAFQQLHGALDGADALAEERFDAAVADARDALFGLPVGCGVLFLGAPVLTVIGVQQRRREYQ